jgi:uncharacterized protein (TIGR03435 family)
MKDCDAKLVIAWLLAWPFCGLVLGQSPARPAARPEFEVASVRTSPKLGSGFVMTSRTTGQDGISFRGITLKDLICWSYSMRSYEVFGPASLTEERYDIVAKATGPAPDDQLRLMARSLLAERFKLEAHMETRSIPAYEIVVGKNGARLHEVTPDGTARVTPGARGISAKQVSMGRFAELLSNKLDRPVVDKTGLTGVFDISLQWTPDAGTAPADDPGPSVFTAIQEQLGLKLEAHKDTIPTLVIDHVEKPSEN